MRYLKGLDEYKFAMSAPHTARAPEHAPTRFERHALSESPSAILGSGGWAELPTVALAREHVATGPGSSSKLCVKPSVAHDETQAQSTKYSYG